MKASLLPLFLFFFSHTYSQIDYFPPLQSDEWDTLSIAELGWCDDQLDELLAFHENNGTRAFLVLKDGKIVIEKYFQGMEMNTPHQWNSAGKTITSLLVGIAQENGLLSIEDKTSDYLGAGWTSMPPEKEDLITIRHQLTMTTGMDDTQFDCLEPSCLTYLADAGTRWSYHNSPYTLLTNVIEAASGQNLNVFAAQNLKQQTGIDGLFIDLGDLEVFFGSPRGMARMGLLMLNQGTWENTVVLGDQDYYNAMITTSQNINEAYGYLWWLNGSSTFMLPGSQIVFPGSPTPNAPDDLYSALGKDGQFLDILPDQNVVVIRMGAAPNGDFVPVTFHNEMWDYLSAMICSSTPVENAETMDQVDIFPNPFDEVIHIQSDVQIKTVRLYNALGQLILEQKNVTQISGSGLADGVYWLELEDLNNLKVVRKVIKQL